MGAQVMLDQFCGAEHCLLAFVSMSAGLGKKMVMGKPPDKGSFPLGHFGECTELKDEYLRCLRSSNHDNMACRHVTKQYLQCRMDHNLMSQEPRRRLGERHRENGKRKLRKKRLAGPLEWMVSSQIEVEGSTSLLRCSLSLE